jgi:hypothetical protein
MFPRELPGSRLQSLSRTQRIFWDLGPGHKPGILLEKYKTVIKLLVAAAVGCQGTKN